MCSLLAHELAVVDVAGLHLERICNQSTTYRNRSVDYSLSQSTNRSTSRSINHMHGDRPNLD